MASPETNIAAIDAGSNGIRVVIAEVDDAVLPRKVKRVYSERIAIRMGADAFEFQRFSEDTIQTVVDAFVRFRGLFDEHGVQHYRAIATSAARESGNAGELVHRIQEAASINLEVIGGLEEAQLMFEAISSAHDLENESALLIDMGGGSVELTVSWNGKALGAETLRLGPVRLMQELKDKGWPEFRTPNLLNEHAFAIDGFVTSNLRKDLPPKTTFGAGGNIECLAELRVPLLGKKKTRKIKLGDLESMIPKLLSMSVEERIDNLDLRPDRADVIAIAAMVLHMVMDESQVSRVLVPGLGIKDGLLFELAQQNLTKGESANDMTAFLTSDQEME